MSKVAFLLDVFTYYRYIYHGHHVHPMYEYEHAWIFVHKFVNKNDTTVEHFCKQSVMMCVHIMP